MTGPAKNASFVDKLKDQLVEHAATEILGAVGLLLNAGMWTGFIDTGFYHEGWRTEHVAWIPLFVVVFLLAIACTLSRGGFVVVGITTLAVAAAFPMVYGNPSLQSGDWPLLAWLLHGVGLGVGTAFVVGLLERLYRRWIR